MTPPELSSEKEHFSTPFTDSEEDYSTDLTLETYFEALSHNESWIPAFDEIEPGSAKHKDRPLKPIIRGVENFRRWMWVPNNLLPILPIRLK